MKKLAVDFINISPNGVVYTVTEEMTDRAILVLKELGYEPVVESHCAKVSVVGAGIVVFLELASKM